MINPVAGKPRKCLNDRVKKIFALIFLGVLIYSNTFHSSFHFDDGAVITHNASIRNLANIPAIWDAFNTRFVVGLSLALNYHLGGSDVLGYHIFNILVHILASLLVGQICVLTFKTPLLSGSALAKRKEWIALLASVLFLTHPIQTQAVNYIWQRAASLATVFYLLSLVFYAKARLQSSKLYYWASLVSAVFGMFSKEITITLPFSIVLYEFCFLRSLGESKLKRFQKILPFLFLLPLIPLVLMRSPDVTLDLMRPQADPLKAHSILESITRFVSEAEMCRGLYGLTQVNVLRTYLRLLFFPIHQNLDYDYPLAHSLWEPNTFFSLGLLLGAMSLGVLLFKRHRLAAFSIFWFFVTLSVESFVPQSDVIFEHRLYLPMVGYSLFASYWLFFFLANKNRRLFIIVAILLVGSYSLLTYERNFVWKNERTLWTDVVQKSPKKARGYLNRGSAYEAVGLLDKAVLDYDQAIKIQPDFAEAYYNRGITHFSMGFPDQAVQDYDKAIGFKPDYADAYNNRGNAYYSKGFSEKAISDFSRAVQIKPDFAEAYNNRSNAYRAKGFLEQAILDCSKAIEIQPDFAEAYNSRGNAYFAKGLFGKALLNYSKAIQIKPDYAGAYSNRGNVYFGKKLFDRAVLEYNQALRLNPDYAEALGNRAVAYYQLGQYDKSREDASRAQRLGRQLDPRFLEDLKKALSE